MPMILYLVAGNIRPIIVNKYIFVFAKKKKEKKRAELLVSPIPKKASIAKD